VPLEDGRLRGATISVRAGEAHDTGGVTGGAITGIAVGVRRGSHRTAC